MNTVNISFTVFPLVSVYGCTSTSICAFYKKSLF
nr:MAG TPA: hypothetical protein [Caudoviricetes sp.]